MPSVFIAESQLGALLLQETMSFDGDEKRRKWKVNLFFPVFPENDVIFAELSENDVVFCQMTNFNQLTSDILYLVAQQICTVTVYPEKPKIKK